MPPSNIAAVNSSSTSLRVEWSEIPRVYRNGIVRAYRIFYREQNALPHLVRNFTVTPNETRIQQPFQSNTSNTTHNRRRRAASTPPERYGTNITGLRIFTNYSIQVQGITISGGTISPPLVVITDEDREYCLWVYTSFNKGCLLNCCIVHCTLLHARTAEHCGPMLRSWLLLECFCLIVGTYNTIFKFVTFMVRCGLAM